MKSKMFGNVTLWLALCGTLLELAACSEKSTAGATVDDNSVVAISADEKAVLEHQVDSTKVVAGSVPADISGYESDSSIYWYEVNFSGEREIYFSYENIDPYFDCHVYAYYLEFGVRSVNTFGMGNISQRTSFLTANEQGIVSHEKIDNLYLDHAICENDFLDFEKYCQNGGGDLFSHFTNCQGGELHLTCTTSRGHLTEGVESILNDYAENMKTRCLENR